MRRHRRRVTALLLSAVLTATGLAATTSPPAAASIDTHTLGARYDSAGSAITFRIRSAAATRMVVHLYATPTGAAERASHVLTRDAAGVFATTVSVASIRAAGITGTVYYGYRAWGPNWPYSSAWTKGSSAGFVADVDAAGNRFNPNKLLVDPYAREISHDPLRPGMTTETVYASGPAYRTIDSGPHAPKGIVLPATTASVGTKPARAFADDIVYEVHVRGLTMNDPGVPAAYRGTYRGAGMKAAYLASLGVTAVEFLPLQETLNDANDVDPTGTAGDNYWGYMTLNWFAPDRRYAADRSPGGPTREFQEMVRAFHDAGIKVLVDVVYNHTGEGGVYQAGGAQVYNLLSWRGLDNPTYYSLTADRQASWDNTGVGGNYNTYNPVAQDLIVDSLAYWKNTLGVDGFRHDLAAMLGNTCQHGCFSYSRTDPGTALNRITREMPPRPAAGGSGVDWIAEPWAIGAGTYQVGNMPAGWSEWNGRYRDTLRRDQNRMGYQAVTPGQLADRFAGSADLYGDDGRRPWNSVNFMVAHDGFTLRDLYACNAKNNAQPWPYGPSDGGTDDNASWDQGGVAADQRRAARNGHAFLMVSAGTPMVTGGDEVLRTTRCNNNPYNVDSSANWLGWSPSAEQATFRTFASRLASFRLAHPALRPRSFYSAADGNGNGMAQLAWFTPAGTAPDGGYWQNPDNHAIAWRIDGTEFGDPAAAIYAAYNGWSGDVNFVLPSPGAGRQWYRVTDTSNWAEGPDQVAQPGAETHLGGQGTNYLLRGRGLLLLIAR
ncbi:glycogen operon protein [Micromonospora nigra]|uniref:Glycogen operon protein n=1 Tax=Micromonospora nigra TaxID=145857 RepID=A0A1C6SGM8_9ACTN|nr:isoamylase [Micromonospora nigra]SCL28607.1 glycogen operon protein [Micromonospora nigra]